MASSLIALLVFENNINKELVRSLHVYRLKDGKEKEVEREFVFSVDGPYVEMKTGPMLRLRRFQVLELFEGQVIGLWRCLFAFHVNNPPHLSHSSFLLSVSRSAFIINVVEKGRIWVFPDSIIDILEFSGQMKQQEKIIGSTSNSCCSFLLNYPTNFSSAFGSHETTPTHLP